MRAGINSTFNKIVKEQREDSNKKKETVKILKKNNSSETLNGNFQCNNRGYSMFKNGLTK